MSSKEVNISEQEQYQPQEENRHYKRMRVSIGPVDNRKPVIELGTAQVVKRIFEIYVISSRRSIEGDQLVSLVDEQQALLNDLQSLNPELYKNVMAKLIEIREKRRALRAQRRN